MMSRVTHGKLRGRVMESIGKLYGNQLFGMGPLLDEVTCYVDILNDFDGPFSRNS